MHKMRPLALLGVLALWIMVLVAGAHFACGDDLLFHSDLWSLVTYFGAVALFASPVLLLGMVLSRWLPESFRTWLRRNIMLALTIVIAAVFLRLAVSVISDCRILSWQTLACFLAPALCVYLLVDRNGPWAGSRSSDSLGPSWCSSSCR